MSARSCAEVSGYQNAGDHHVGAVDVEDPQLVMPIGCLGPVAVGWIVDAAQQHELAVGADVLVVVGDRELDQLAGEPVDGRVASGRWR